MKIYELKKHTDHFRDWVFFYFGKTAVKEIETKLKQEKSVFVKIDKKYYAVKTTNKNNCRELCSLCKNGIYCSCVLNELSKFNNRLIYYYFEEIEEYQAFFGGNDESI